MSDFKEGDLLMHRASGERCIFLDYRDGGHLCVVSASLGETYECRTEALIRIKGESK